MANKTRKPRRLPDDLSALIDASQPVEGATAAGLWARFRKSRSDVDRNALFSYYASYLFRVAVWLKRRRPAMFPAPLEELISDGTDGLLRAIEEFRPASGRSFKSLAMTAIRRRLWREAILQRFVNTHVFRDVCLVAALRESLTQRLGYVPTEEELAGELAGQITNKHFFRRGDGHRHAAWSQLGRDESAPSIVDYREQSPDQPSLDREALRVAMRSMDARDRKMFRAWLLGETLQTIGTRFGISRERVRQRLNGCLWEARRRADVADYLEATPAERDLETEHRKPRRIA
jgi:RNA polymerase sigma factor (sigma-70 family)